MKTSFQCLNIKNKHCFHEGLTFQETTKEVNIKKRKKRVPSAKPVVKKHLERTVNFSWSQILEDPRSKINLKWNFDYVINTAFFSMLTGQLDLRKVEDFSENFVPVMEHGGGKIIPEGLNKPGHLYTVSRGKTGMIGIFKLETQVFISYY